MLRNPPPRTHMEWRASEWPRDTPHPTPSTRVAGPSCRHRYGWAVSPGSRHPNRAFVSERSVDGSKPHNLGQSKVSKGPFITRQDSGRKKTFSLSGVGKFLSQRIDPQCNGCWRITSLATEPKEFWGARARPVSRESIYLGPQDPPSCATSGRPVSLLPTQS